MNTLLKTGAVLLGLFAGMAAVSAATDQDDNFGSEEFWTEVTQGE